MKAFFRKHRFKIVLTFLVIVFVYICFYMLWVHVPYTKHKNDVVNIIMTMMTILMLIKIRK